MSDSAPVFATTDATAVAIETVAEEVEVMEIVAVLVGVLVVVLTGIGAKVADENEVENEDALIETTGGTTTVLADICLNEEVVTPRVVVAMARP